MKVVAGKHGVELFDLQALNTEVQGYCTFIQYSILDRLVPSRFLKHLLLITLLL